MKMTLELKKFEIDEAVEADLEFEVEYAPGRPAPACSDHDAPGFSDPGDPPELQVLRAWAIEGTRRSELSPKARNESCFQDALYEAAEKQFQKEAR